MSNSTDHLGARLKRGEMVTADRNFVLECLWGLFQPTDLVSTQSNCEYVTGSD